MNSIDKVQPVITFSENSIVEQDIQEQKSSQNDTFQTYLHQFEKNPVRSFPIEVKKKLLGHYEELLAKQQISMHEAEKTIASGDHIMVPIYMQEMTLGDYQNKVKFLNDSIKIDDKIES